MPVSSDHSPAQAYHSRHSVRDKSLGVWNVDGELLRQAALSIRLVPTEYHSGFVLVTSVSICKTTKQSKPDSLQVCDVVKTQIKSILEHLYYFRVCIILKRTFSLQNIN